MNLQQFRFLREAARHKFNITLAARALHASQHGISKAIIELEGELGVPILARQGKRILGVTPPGQQVLDAAERIMKEVDDLRKMARDYAGAPSGTLRVATTHRRRATCCRRWCSSWLRVGALVAIQPEGGSNWVVGMVRRVSKTPDQRARGAIETLSRTPAISQFVVTGARNTSERGVLLRGNDLRSPEVQIALRPGIFAPGQNLEAARDGRQHVYTPTGFSARGRDYEIGRFRELVREA